MLKTVLITTMLLAAIPKTASNKVSYNEYHKVYQQSSIVCTVPRKKWRDFLPA